MVRASRVAGLALLCGLCGATAARSAETYNYTVRHPSFGAIGTYTDRVDRSGGDVRIETTVHVAVRALGIVVHREDAERTEIWHDGRLAAFHGVTTTNGTRVEIQGAAQPDGFVVSSPGGTAVAPLDIVPSDPWQASRGGSGGETHDGVMMSTRTGRFEPVQVAGGAPERITVDGFEVPVRHYTIATDKRQDVWVDARGIPIVFRSVENGTPIDFVLSRERVAALAALAP
jgi:hypothetical protein